MNGVVHTLERMSAAAEEWGGEFQFLTPLGFATLPLPTYPSIQIALPGPGEVGRRSERPGRPHPHRDRGADRLGGAGRLPPARTLVHHELPYALSRIYSARTAIPESWTYEALRRFHAPAAAVMAPTPSIREELRRRGFDRVKVWTRGVDHALFRPQAHDALDLPGPIFLSVGRVAVEKNLEAVLSLGLPGSTVVVGDGPARAMLERRWPKARFLGAQFGEALARIYASADVFVFPSRTDTFGIVLLEALASGLPVAAFPVTGPLDVIGDSGAGALHEDLREACLAALQFRATTRESIR